MSEINEITFKHNDNAFTIGFSALSFYQSNKNTYAYKLTGYNDDWVLLGPTHELTFNSLEAGSYILQIVATNNDGLWSDKPLVLKIIIKPPIWETWWFILIVFITFSILVIGYVFFRINEAKKINKYLTQQVEERTKEINYQKLEIEIQKKNLENTNVELQKVNSTKDKFFSIIAHDLKSPFNAILGFSRLLNEEYSSLSDENRRAFAGNIKDASEATYRLLENLLEWSRMQANKIEFKPEVIDIGNIVLETFSLLHSSAEAKNIRLSSSVMFNTTAFADENMIKTVVRNLVSNAIKFTQTDGEVKISVSENNDYKEMSISDNGVGISENDFKVLFHVDVSLKNRGTANESGTGLGLIICKEFIERNGGTITVKSMIGIGSTFLFTLPKSDKV
jgi:signal transduction histidine kinase